MKRKYKRRTSRFGIFFVFLTAVTIAGVFFIPWAMKPDNFRNEKNKINSWLNGIFFQDFYNAKSLILVDLSNDNIFISKRENEQQLPASLAKLFVIEYAATLADLDSIVPANYEASLLVAKEEDLIKNLNPK
ncbi:peptidase S11, partial [Ruminococcus sp. AF14-5]